MNNHKEKIKKSNNITINVNDNEIKSQSKYSINY